MPPLAMENHIMKKALLILFLSLLIPLGGCGSSGTWDDAPENWTRAFRSKKPKDVNVIHSRYWRSPHWTYEFEYFFEIERNDKLNAQLFSQNRLKKIEGKEAEEAMSDFFGGKPKWFIPQEAAKHEIYVYEDEPQQRFRVFINKKSGTIYLTDYQV